jgi:hypothetical protein
MGELKPHHIEAKPALDDSLSRTNSPKIPGPAKVSWIDSHAHPTPQDTYPTYYGSVIHGKNADSGNEAEWGQRSSQFNVWWNPNVEVWRQILGLLKETERKVRGNSPAHLSVSSIS